MLASTFRVFRRLNPSGSDKRRWENLCKTFLAYFQNLRYFISRLFSHQVKKINVSQANTLVGRNESGWSIFLVGSLGDGLSEDTPAGTLGGKRDTMHACPEAPKNYPFL